MSVRFQKIKQKLVNDFYLQSSIASLGYLILLIFFCFVTLLDEDSMGFTKYLHILYVGITLNLFKFFYAFIPYYFKKPISDIHLKTHLTLVIFNCFVLTWLFSHTLNFVPAFQNEFWFIFFLINIINTASAFSVVISPITVFLFIGILGIVPPFMFYIQIEHAHQLLEKNSLFILFFSFIYNLFLILRARAHQKMIYKLYRYEEDLALQSALTSEALKLSAIGEMAGGIAHEINNPLAIIYHYTKKLQNPTADSLSQTEEKLQKIIKAIKRIENVIDGLKTYAQSNRLDKSNYQKITFFDILNITRNITQAKLDAKNIKVDVQYPENLSPLFVNQGEISQVLVHLFNNAIEAIDHPNGLITIHLKENESHLEIYYSDNGSGIAKDIQDKIFIPFFSTKDPQHHHGIGLSTSMAIIDSHGGELRLLPLHPTSITTFLIKLPKNTTP